MATVPGQMFDNFLNPLKGWWDGHALDFRAKISANVTFDLPAGRTVHLNSSGELETGCVAYQMALFTFAGAADFDVNSTGSSQWTPQTPSGYVTCLVATGGYELETTEFNTALTYARNDLLKAPVANTTLATGGVLTNDTVTPASNQSNPSSTAGAVCGVVSRGKYTNALGKSVLAFWPVWYPGRSGET